MRVALLFSGLVRTLEQTWPVIQQTFAHYSPDVYVYLNEPEREAAVRSLVHPTPLRLRVEADLKLDERDYASRIGPGVNDIQNDLRQMYGLQRVNALRKSWGVQYDWVVRLRSDLAITAPPEPLEALSPSVIYVPRFSNWFGYNDRFAIGHPKLMDTYMDRYYGFPSYFELGGVFHMESYLAYWLRMYEIPVGRTRVVFDVLRTDGKRDAPCWGPAYGDIV